MQLIDDFNNLESMDWFGQSAVTIGNFDGCHLGHQKLVSDTVRYGQKLGVPTVAVTFSPRPEAFFRGNEDEVLLFSWEQKTRAFEELGVDYHVVQKFDDAFSRTSHEDFYNHHLRDVLNAQAVVVGDNFRFGRDRLGNPGYLRDQLASEEREISVDQPILEEGIPISSTRIRVKLREVGSVESVTKMLGRPYLLEGEIVKGNQLGRTIGFPTANLGYTVQMLPAVGVYAGYVWLRKAGSKDVPSVMKMAEDVVPAVFNIGRRPTIKETCGSVHIEAHLLKGEYAPDVLYGVHVGYYLTHRIRSEKAFDGLDGLKQQIKVDVDKAKSILS